MSSEDQDILAKISRLRGQIDHHKTAQQQSPTLPTHHHVTRATSGWHSSRGSPRGRPYHRGGRATQVHRNKTLVLNASSAAHNSNINIAHNVQAGEGSEVNSSSSANPLPPPAWVTKTDRHLQLINPAIFEKQSQERAKAIEETRRLKLKQRDERERAKLSKHLQRLAANSHTAGHVQAGPQKSSGSNEIVVQGVHFRVVKNGSKLVKISSGISNRYLDNLHSLNLGDDNIGKPTPKTAVIGGVKFYRSKNGNLYRSGIVKAQRYSSNSLSDSPGGFICSSTDSLFTRRSGIVKKIDEPCKNFSITGSSYFPPCRLWQPNGRCHIHVSPTAPVCRSFGIYGFCEKGANCTERHVNECPDFSNTGVCKTKGCKLLHRDKASNLRKNNGARLDQSDNDEASDLSSDDDADEMDSDDIDSDEVDEEYFGDDHGEEDEAVPTQQDFIQL